MSNFKNEKSDEMNMILENMSRLIGNPRSVAFSKKICVICGGDAKDFTSELSKKEYTLSGMCQSCQDSFFE